MLRLHRVFIYDKHLHLQFAEISGQRGKGEKLQAEIDASSLKVEGHHVDSNEQTTNKVNIATYYI